MRKRKRNGSRLLAAVLAAMLCLPPTAFAAEGDPVLRFDLTTERPLTGLTAGDQILVDVEVSRADGSAEPFDLYSLMLDIQYDNELLEASQLKTPGLKRPDGANWIGSWSCNPIPGGGGDKQVRVLYLNIGGLMSSPPSLDRVSGPQRAASFLLTVKKDAPDERTAVQFYFTESGGSDYKAGPSVVGNELTLEIGGAGGTGGSENGAGSNGGSGSDNGSGSGSGNDSGSGAGSGGSGSGSSGGTNSGSGGSAGGAGGSSGDGSGDSSSGSGSDPGSDNASGSGTTGGSDSGSGSTGPANGAVQTPVAFSELTDIDETHWAAPYVRYLMERGIVSGNEQKEFKPEQPVSRAEFSQMVVSACGYESGSPAQSFHDVSPGDWYYQPVMALAQAGVVSGLGGGAFGAEATLSRQDMAVILSKVMRDQNIMLPRDRDYAEFSDQPRVADYAQTALSELYCTGIISGTGEGLLSPEAPSTRAQAATVITAIVKKVEEGR